MSRKLPDLLLTIAFILIVFISFFSPLPPSSKLFAQDCSAQTNSSVTCWLKAWINLPSAFNTYFSNHYRLHQQEVDILESARFHLLHEKTFPNVLIGKEDWLYYTGENNLQDYECTIPFTVAELAAVREHLLEWDAQLQQRGIRFYVVIAPNKESIYPQYLPNQVQAGVRACRVDQVMQELQGTTLEVLDLRAVLKTAAQSKQVYYRTDTHWNSVGAMIASREILSLLSRDFPNLTIPSPSDYSQEISDISGDLAGFLPKDKRFVEKGVFLVPHSPPAAVFKAGPDEIEVSTIPGSHLPNAVVFCDSFSDALKPFLSERFSRVVYSRSFNLDLGLIDQEKPAVVILELAQRYLTVLR